LSSIHFQVLRCQASFCLGGHHPREKLDVKALAGDPAMSLGIDQRMERVGADRGTPDRQAGGGKTLAVTRHQLGLADALQAGAEDPGLNVAGSVQHAAMSTVAIMTRRQGREPGPDSARPRRRT
jgi:hypothetical protein